MPLTAGDKLGHYQIVSLLGQGGMGEVYQALDTKLDRDVAIKVLPAALSSEPDRLARFEREAKVLAQLNHPGIASIYGLEGRALVMELVPGPTLAERIAQGPIPAVEAEEIFLQIADALEYAHERGIVHRDLKPANIKIDPEDNVKILDFGLAKALSDPTASAAGDPTESPTITMGGTIVGTILGTAAYMAPEQARGKKVDRRADIWAFGVVVWEMLTGERLFKGEDTVQVLSRVLEQPADLDRVPPKFRKLLSRCLDRNVKDRLRDIGEARFLLEAPAVKPGSDVDGAITSRAIAPRSKLPWIVAAVVTMALAALAFVHFREQPPDNPVERFSIPAPEGTSLSLMGNARAPVAISPDGRRLVFGAAGADGKGQLWVRALDSLNALQLANTEGASFPFWSPDSRFVGFFADGKLKKIDVAGGFVSTLCPAAAARGGTWSQEGVIVFAPDNNGPLHRVLAAGGSSSPVTTLDQKRNAVSDRWPWFLPDGRHFIYVEQNSPQGNVLAAVIRVASLDSDIDSKVVLEAGFSTIYSQGYLLFLRDGTLAAQRFDLKLLATTADAVPVAEQVGDVGLRRGTYSASVNGLLVYGTGSGLRGAQLAWLNRNGKEISRLGDPGILQRVHLSPDRKSASLSIVDQTTSNEDVWVYDVARRIKNRFTFDSGADRESVWSPDGFTIVFNSNRKGHFDLYRKASSLEGMEEVLYADGFDKYPTGFSPDGKFLLYYASDPKTKSDLWVLPLTGNKSSDRKPFPFAQTAFDETEGQFSPDGEWIAYSSNESQQFRIYIAPFPGPGGKRQVSIAGGRLPIWRRDGKELFYLGQDGMLMAAEVNVKGAVLDVGAVRPLFGIRDGVGYTYDVSLDGQSFLVRTVSIQTSSEPLTLIRNWTASLKK